MKHQGKPFVVVLFVVWMMVAAMLGGSLGAHILALLSGIAAASFTDLMISLYVRKVIRKKNSKL